MFKFFQGPRGIFGCVALFAVCVFATTWVRSNFTGDYLALAIGKTRVAILSQQGILSIATFAQSTNEQSAEQKSGWWTVKLPATELNFVHYPTAVPYWAIIVALLLLSAGLLLGKPPTTIAKLPPITGKPASSSKRPNPKAKRSR